MTQYVEKFPLPDPCSALVQKIILLTKRIYETIDTEDVGVYRQQLDTLVWQAFGLAVEEVAR